MQVKSQSLIPVHTNFLSSVTPKSQGTQQASPLSVSTSDAMQIKPKEPQPIERKLVVPVIDVNHRAEVIGLLGERSRRVDLGDAMYLIDSAIAGGPGSPKYIRNADGSYLGEKNWQNFMDGALKSGDQKETYILLAGKLAGHSGSGEKDLNAFTAFASELSSKDLQAFLKAYQVSPVTLSGEVGQVTMDFAAVLSGDDMENFITAVHNSPEELQGIINTGSKLSKNDLSNYLAAASNAMEDVYILDAQVDNILSRQQDANSVNLSSYLSAAAKTGTLVLDFIEATKDATMQAAGNIANFINTEVDGENDLKNFVSIIKTKNEMSIRTIIDTSSSLGEEDKSNLLDTASRAGENLGLFTRSFSKFTQPDSVLSPTDFSNFLSTASKAEGNLDVLVKMADQLDLAFTSTLSVVDTVNFLDVAKEAGGKLDKLSTLGNELSGSDRSNFFYAAAQAGKGLGDFLTQTDNLTGDDKSEFLLSSAHKNQEDTPAVYMKGLLTKEEYDNFQKSAEMISPDQVADLVDITGESKGAMRSSFLDIAASAGENTGELTTTLKRLSTDDQIKFLDVAQGLSEQNLGKLTRATGNAGENFSEFISLAKELRQSDKAGLGYFLSAASAASSKDLGELVEIVNKLGVRQQQTDNVSGADMRHSFLMVASDASHNLNGLINMAENIVTVYQPSTFTDIFNSAEAVTDQNLGKFIEAYI